MSDFRVEGEATLDVSDVIRGLSSMLREIKSADKEVNKLSRDLDELAAKRIDVSVDVSGIEDLQMLRREIDSIDGDSINIDVDVDAGFALAELAEVQAAVEELDGRDIDIPVDTRGLMDLQDAAGGAQRAIGMGGTGGGGLIASVALLGTALVPLGIVATGLTGGLVSSFATAGVGIGAFAAFAIPTIKKVFDVSDQLAKVADKIKTASNAKELNAALKEQSAILDGLNPRQLAAIKNLKALKDRYKGLAKILQNPVLDIFNSGLKLANQLLDYAAPIALQVSESIKTLLDRANAGLKTDSWKKFFDYIETSSGGFILQWGTAVGNFITGIANMIRAFDPLSKFVSGGLLKISEAFLRWSQGLENNKGWQNFVNYVIDNTPKAWELIKKLGKAIWDFGVAVEPIGRKVIEVTTGILQWISDFKKANPEVAGLAVKVGIFAAAVYPLAGIILTVFGPIGLLVAAIAGLVGWFIAMNPKARESGGLFDTLKQTWDKVAAAAGGVWEALQKMWQILKDSGAINQLTSALQQAAENFQFWIPILKIAAIVLGGVLLASIIAISYALNGMAHAAEWIANIIVKVVGIIVKTFQFLYMILVGHSIIPDLINAIKGLFGGLLSWFTGNLTSIKNWFVNTWNNISSTVRTKATNIKNDITNFLNTAKTNAASALNAAKTSISNAVEGARQAVSDKVGAIRKFFSDLPGQIKGALGNLGSLLYNSGADIIRGLLNGITSLSGSVIQKAKDIAGSVKDTIAGALHIGSPSKDLMDLGHWAVAGLVKGLDKSTSSVIKTVSKIADVISGASLPNVGVLGARSVGNSTLAPAAASTGPTSSSHIGMYVAPGAISISGGGNGSAGQDVLSKLSRLARFGQFAGDE